MDLADNGMNQVLVNREVLENYLVGKYPNFKYISSTTKRIKDLDTFKKELEKGYFMCVLDYDLNHNEEVLSALEPEASRVEILVDEVCYSNCPKRSEHYKDESKMQLTFDVGTAFDCANKRTDPSFAESMKRPAFISNEEIGSYIERGFCNFKLVGRGLPMQMVKDSYMYYLVKPEHRDFISKKLISILEALTRKPSGLV